MPQKSTLRFFAITSGTVLPLASANCCLAGLKGAAEDFRECLLAIAFAFKVKVGIEIKESGPYLISQLWPLRSLRLCGKLPLPSRLLRLRSKFPAKTQRQQSYPLQSKSLRGPDDEEAGEKVEARRAAEIARDEVFAMHSWSNRKHAGDHSPNAGDA